MTDQTKRTTVYLEPDLHKALRLKAISVSQSVSELINGAVRKLLTEDAADLTVFEERQDEIPIPYDEFVKRLQQDGLI